MGRGRGDGCFNYYDRNGELNFVRDSNSWDRSRGEYEFVIVHC